jgi:hypothetical protein
VEPLSSAAAERELEEEAAGSVLAPEEPASVAQDESDNVRRAAAFVSGQKTLFSIFPTTAEAMI